MPLPGLFRATQPKYVQSSLDARAIHAANTGQVVPEWRGAPAADLTTVAAPTERGVMEAAAEVPAWMIGAGIVVAGVGAFIAWKKWGSK